MKYRSLIVLLFLMLAGCQRSTISSSQSFSLRLADYVATPGMTETKLRSAGESLFLASQDIVAGPDFESVLTTFDEKGRPGIVLRVNESAGNRMREVISDNQGTVMVMVINGVPELAIPIPEHFDNEFLLSGSYTGDEIVQMHSLITGYK